MLQDLTGKTAIITGASSGFGKASAYALAREGVNLMLTARSEDKLVAIAAECEELGVRATYVAGDCRDERCAIDVVAAAVREFGRIDILLANAGICISGLFLESTMEQYDEQMDTNMRSMYAICLHALPEMLKLDESQLIVVSSVTGHVGHANEVAYSATKFANRGFAQALNNEYRSQGLKVCTLCPSAANTMFDIGQARTVEGNNASLMLLPEDVAEAVVFVCKQPARTSRVMEMSLASMAGN